MSEFIDLLYEWICRLNVWVTRCATSEFIDYCDVMCTPQSDSSSSLSSSEDVIWTTRSRQPAAPSSASDDDDDDFMKRLSKRPTRVTPQRTSSRPVNSGQWLNYWLIDLIWSDLIWYDLIWSVCNEHLLQYLLVSQWKNMFTVLLFLYYLIIFLSFYTTVYLPKQWQL